jgi:fructan beta-fructosidase
MIRLIAALALALVPLLAGTRTARASDPITVDDIPRWYTTDSQVEPLITLAARFQALGKDEAQKLLVELASTEKVMARHKVRLRAEGLTGALLENAVDREEARENKRRDGLKVLCRLLFVARPNGEFRGPGVGSVRGVGNTTRRDWPTYPFEVVDGVPFCVADGAGGATGGTSGGQPVAEYLDYCLANCDWNPEKFAPRTLEQQQKALEKLLAYPKLKDISAENRLFLARQMNRPDILIADFEGDTYGKGWTTTGTAFGKGPAKGTLPNQMPVTGYLGKGLVNSYLDGDGSTGTLTSPEFKIERRYLNFLIGGGKYPGKTCINLRVKGALVCTATGPNDKPGGSEHLDWHSWDLDEFEGKTAVIEIVDEEKGGWGHINVDHILLSDSKKQAELLKRELTIEMPYLLLPVQNGAPKRRMKFTVNERTVREFDIELATTGKPHFWVTADVTAFKGKRLTVEAVLPADTKLSELVVPSNKWAEADKLYSEKHRPLFHFTSRVGWLNDPNGLVYANGQWHLFYQHNPFGREWGNMHWGHATSTDLFHWNTEGIALYPKRYDDWAFSGSAVLDKANTSGWGTKEKPPLVLAYTSTARGECIAYSTDNGRTWSEYDKNPVVKHAGRDPKLLWYEKGKHWVMAVYDEFEKKQWIAFYTSPDLKEWKFASRIEGFFECPDLFPLPELDVPNWKWVTAKWMLHAADGKYLLGDFDGKEFKPDFQEKKQLWYGRFYAAQTFDNAPKYVFKANIGPPLPPKPRRVQIGWAQGVTFPGTPFNQQMTVPVELALFQNKKGAWQLYAEPVSDELEALREKRPVYEGHGHRGWTRDPGTNILRSLLGDKLDAFDLDITVKPFKTKELTFDLRGTKLVYDVAKEALTCKDVAAPVKLDDGKLRLRVLVDRGSIEVFVHGGQAVMSIAAIPDEKNDRAELIAPGTDVTVEWLALYRLRSAWEK